MRYFLQLADEGTKFHGWQSQPELPTVQEALQQAISKINNAPITHEVNLVQGGGAVGNVGGVGQKAAAAHEAGAAAFIVPVDAVDEAEPHARDMPVIGVATLQEALDALASLGGETVDLELIER